MTDAALPDAAPGGTPGQPAVVLRNVVIHLNNEQPVLADLFEIPSPRDIAVLCTNLRTPDGKRPVFIDQTDSTFLLPLAHIRFIEIPEGADRDRRWLCPVGPQPDGASPGAGRARHRDRRGLPAPDPGRLIRARASRGAEGAGNRRRRIGC